MGTRRNCNIAFGGVMKKLLLTNLAGFAISVTVVAQAAVQVGC